MAAKKKNPKILFQFGQYRGKSVDYVMERDPDYIVWCWNNVAKCYRPFDKAVYEQALGKAKHAANLRAQARIYAERMNEEAV